MSQERHAQQDPTLKHPQPTFPEQDQRDRHPGLEGHMEPRPDYGEETYRGCSRLEDRAAVITGGDSGIGRAVALAFAREGADVLISYLEAEEPDAEETARVVEESGKRCVRVPGDISEEAQCNRVIERAVEEFGRVDVLVNNAAHQRTVSGVVDVSTELLDKTFKTNIYAMFWLVKAAIPHMPQGGAIINVGSAQAFKPSPTLLPYSATKGSIVTFTEGLAQDGLYGGRDGLSVRRTISDGPPRSAR
jgi:NAD(P)-dependent dehydrogenase (short-subunit alcohol dehydrogenase family)